ECICLGKWKLTEDTGVTCEEGYGICRKKCRTHETEVHFCINGKRCCINSDSTILSRVVLEDVDWAKILITTRQAYY
uniref:Beta-defensin n=1 Tax=Equus caballus TaxID=9796 RepID=A0A3Q2HM34_HORSE